MGSTALLEANQLFGVGQINGVARGAVREGIAHDPEHRRVLDEDHLQPLQPVSRRQEIIIEEDHDIRRIDDRAHSGIALRRQSFRTQHDPYWQARDTTSAQHVALLDT